MHQYFLLRCKVSSGTQTQVLLKTHMIRLKLSEVNITKHHFQVAGLNHSELVACNI